MIWEVKLSELITETYGRPYRLQQGGMGEFLGQDTIVSVSVPEEADDVDVQLFAIWLQQDATPPADSIARWKWKLEWERYKAAPIQPILNDLHEKGLLDAGDYVIHVWW